jgi:hypothetical protein
VRLRPIHRNRVAEHRHKAKKHANWHETGPIAGFTFAFIPKNG